MHQFFSDTLFLCAHLRNQKTNGQVWGKFLHTSKDPTVKYQTEYSKKYFEIFFAVFCLVLYSWVFTCV
jgi:hypothetical protein